jgi:polyhydroxyalkanoate synthesis regulator protein
MPDTPPAYPILVKRYAQSRLYDTDAARYRTIAELRHWAATGVRFTVVDTETGHDVTQVLLA